MFNQLAAATEVDLEEFRRWKEAGSPIVPRGTADLPGPPRVPGPPTGLGLSKRFKVSFKTNSRTSTVRQRPKPFNSTPAARTAAPAATSAAPAATSAAPAATSAAPAATSAAPATTFVTVARIEQVPRNLREDPDAILPADSPTPPVGTAATRAARAAAAAEKRASLRF